jgi:urease accessory protein
MTLPTITRTETTLSVTRTSGGGRVVVRHRSLGGPDRPVIRPVVVRSDADGAVVSLVPEGALLLAGDAVSISIEVGPGASLTLIEPAGTVAYDMRGDSATWDVSVTVGTAGRLVWHGEPFVVAAGAAVERSVRVVVDQGARVALRESLVLGRHGEAPGSLRQSLRLETVSGCPLLVDGLDTSDLRADLACGRAKVLGSVVVWGVSLESELAEIGRAHV